MKHITSKRRFVFELFSHALFARAMCSLAMEQAPKKRKFQTVGDHRIDDEHAFAEIAAIYLEFGLHGKQTSNTYICVYVTCVCVRPTIPRQDDEEAAALGAGRR